MLTDYMLSYPDVFSKRDRYSPDLERYGTIYEMKELEKHQNTVPKLQFLINLYSGMNQQEMTYQQLEDLVLFRGGSRTRASLSYLTSCRTKNLIID